MRVHYLQHVPFEGLGSIELALQKRGHTVADTQLYDNQRLPDLNQFDLLIVMGGPMSVHDQRAYSWLAREMELIEGAIAEGKRVLGICLGAQLIAHVLGARVYAGAQKEIGWFPVERTDEAATTALGRVMPEVVEAFHWHGETFDIPAGANRLGRSEACENQAFVYQDRVLALQYHLETTRASAQALIDNCSHELIEGPYIQTSDSILSCDNRFAQINGVMESILDKIAGAA